MRKNNDRAKPWKVGEDLTGKGFFVCVHSLFTHLKGVLDATKVELGEKAKKTIGIVGIVLICIVILVSFVEGFLGYYGHSNWFEGGASVSPRVPIPPGWNGAEDAAFTIVIAAIVFIVIPVTWGVGVYIVTAGVGGVWQLTATS